MARTLRSDKGLFLAVLFLVCVSAVMVSSASAAAALQNNWHIIRYLFKQSTWVIAGFLLMAVTMKINYRGYQQPFVVWAGLGIIAVSLMLVLVAAPEINGSRRWFGIGGIGVQPSEFAKLALVLFLADLMSRRMDKVNDMTAVVVPVGMVVGCLVGLTLLQPDLGTSAGLALKPGLVEEHDVAMSSKSTRVLWGRRLGIPRGAGTRHTERPRRSPSELPRRRRSSPRRYQRLWPLPAGVVHCRAGVAPRFPICPVPSADVSCRGRRCRPALLPGPTSTSRSLSIQ